MKNLFFGLLFFQNAYSLDLNFNHVSEHIEILCTEQDLSICDDLLEASEKMYHQLTQEFAHQMDHKISVYLYPDIHSFHQAIHQENAPDWLIVSDYDSAIQMTSPLHPGSYHTPENIKKALCRGIIHRFIYDKFPKCHAPWWLLSGVTAVKTNWPYVTRPSTLPEEDLETWSNKTPGLGWCSWSLVSFIEKTYGWEAIHQLLEDYFSFDIILGMSKKELVLQWQASIQESFD